MGAKEVAEGLRTHITLSKDKSSSPASTSGGSKLSVTSALMPLSSTGLCTHTHTYT